MKIQLQENIFIYGGDSVKRSATVYYVDKNSKFFSTGDYAYKKGIQFALANGWVYEHRPHELTELGIAMMKLCNED